MRLNRSPVDEWTAYRTRPVDFARERLGVELTADQRVMLEAMHRPPYRVLTRSGHNIGKTFGAAVAAVHWFYTRARSVVITTAPTERDVVDLLWAEIRLLVRRAGLPDFFVGPSAPYLYDHEEHWAKGYTARRGESFQGRHRESMLFIFDEAEGIDATFWRSANSMFKADGGHAWLAILNPTTTTSQSYQEERAVGPGGERKWNVITISSLDHPNIGVGLRNRDKATRGEPPDRLPVPNAVSLRQAEDWIADWFEPVTADERDPERDIEFPPGSGEFYRPGPEGESRVLGRRPSAGTFGVWSERLWKLACECDPLSWRPGELPQIGHDAARYGDDRSETHVRVGPCSLHHEDHGGWDVVRQADRLMELAREYAAWATRQNSPQVAPVDPKQIPVKVDDTGVGGGVTDILAANGYNVVPVNAGGTPNDPTKYPRVRDELWFAVRERARRGQLDLTRLGRKRLSKLEVQALAPTWKPTPDRRRQVEPKEETKKRIGRSPDGMDAVNLAFFEAHSGEVAAWVGRGRDERQDWRQRHGGR